MLRGSTYEEMEEDLEVVVCLVITHSNTRCKIVLECLTVESTVFSHLPTSTLKGFRFSSFFQTRSSVALTFSSLARAFPRRGKL